MPARRSLLLCCAALLSCTGSQPATPTPVSATPTATPQPTTVAPGPAPAAKPGPAPAVAEPELSMPYPAGIVPPYDRLGGVIVRPQELAGPEPFAGPLTRIDECAAAPAECSYPAGVLGFHADGRVAVIEAPAVPGCGEGDPLASWGRVGRPDALADAPRRYFKPGKGDATGAGKALAFVKAQARAGFKAPDDLMFLSAEKPVGISGVVALALLREPLAGWLLHVTDNKLELVDPGNKTVHILGDLPNGGGEPSIAQAVIDPARAQLWVTVAFNDGGHCSALPVSVLHWPLPDGVAKAR